MTKPKRGEKMARRFIAEIRRTGLPVVDERDGLAIPSSANLTPEQLEVAAGLALMALARPRNFGTLRRLLRGDMT